jgi:hypothetical protein
MLEVNLNHTEFADLSSEILGRGSALRFRAHGSSMLPFIRAGDILTIEPVPVTALKVGDVVFYRAAGDGLIAHRLVGREMHNGQMILLMRGDATTSPAERIQPEQILGRAASLQRGRKTIPQDRGLWRRAALLWLRLSPLRFFLLRLAHAVKRAVLPAQEFDED